VTRHARFSRPAHTHLLAAAHSPASALTAGVHRALLAAAIFLLTAPLIAPRTRNVRSEAPQPGPNPAPEPELVPATIGRTTDGPHL
jgi:hypothetical protein